MRICSLSCNWYQTYTEFPMEGACCCGRDRCLKDLRTMRELEEVFDLLYNSFCILPKTCIKEELIWWCWSCLSRLFGLCLFQVLLFKSISCILQKYLSVTYEFKQKHKPEKLKGVSVTYCESITLFFVWLNGMKLWSNLALMPVSQRHSMCSNWSVLEHSK